MAKNLNLGNFSTISRSNISKLQIFLKNSFHSNWRSHLVLTSGQKPKKLFEPLEKYQSIWIWANLETFTRISPNQEFFSKILSFCYLYSPLTSCKNSEKSLDPFLRKLRYQSTNQRTNQPIITNNNDFIGPRWRQRNKVFASQFSSICWLILLYLRKGKFQGVHKSQRKAYFRISRSWANYHMKFRAFRVQ